MGRGQVGDNSRRVRDVRPIEAGSLEALLSATNIPALWLDLSKSNRIRQWFQRSLVYARAGLAADTMAFAREFDGIIYIDSVGPPNFGIR
jgi:erythromycin esterase-like protein